MEQHQSDPRLQRVFDFGHELGVFFYQPGQSSEQAKQSPDYSLRRGEVEKSAREALKPSAGPYATGWVWLVIGLLFVIVCIGMGTWSWWGLLFIPMGLMGLLLVIGGLPRTDETAVKKTLEVFDQGFEAGRVYSASTASLTEWRTLNPSPSAQPNGIHFVDAEHWIRDWMESMGAENAVVTQQSNDGGVDIVTPHYIAQVKNYGGTVPISHIRDFIGVTATDLEGRIGLFFNAGTYPRTAAELMDRVGIAAFIYDVTNGAVSAHNSSAEKFITRGLRPDWLLTE